MRSAASGLIIRSASARAFLPAARHFAILMDGLIGEAARVVGLVACSGCCLNIGMGMVAMLSCGFYVTPLLVLNEATCQDNFVLSSVLRKKSRRTDRQEARALLLNL